MGGGAGNYGCFRKTNLEKQQQGQLPSPDQCSMCGGAVRGQEAQQLAGSAGHVLQLRLPGHHQEEEQEVHEAAFRQLLHLLF